MSIRKSIVTSSVAAIQSKLDAANGRRRERTIAFREAVQSIREALRDGYGYVNGGTVANSYGYCAYQTQVGAFAANDAVILTIHQSSAGKGTGLPLPWRRNTNEDKIAEIITSSTVRPYPQSSGTIRMSRRTARAIVAAQDHADAIKAIERIPAEYCESETPVTAADSLASGNCESETRRVQSWFPGRESVPAKEILAAIVTNAPSLISFAVRAIQYAERHAAVAV